MHRIDTSTAQKDKFGQGKNGFTRGNPQTGTPATQLDYSFFDSVQEEIANAIESAGIILNKEKHDQLKQAIQQYVTNGKIKLSSSITSESQTEAATSLAVKTVNDNAVKKSGDTIYGQLIIDSDWSGLKIKNSQGNLWITRAHPDNSYSISSFDTSTNTNQFKLRYVGSLNKWRFENIEDVTINGKSALKVGDGGLFSKAPLLPSGTNLLSDDVLSVSQTFTLAGNYLNAPITGITGTLIVTRRMFDEGAGATLEINQTNNKYYKTTARKSSAGWVLGGWIEQITTANINDYLPVGVPMPWPSVTPPDGWLICNGWKFDKSLYPGLAAAYPSGYLPEMRATTIRGLDAGRGIDVGRAILSEQGDAMRNLTGTFGFESNIGGNTGGADISGVFYSVPDPRKHVKGGTEDGNSLVKMDASRQVPVANEFRVRNTAFLYIVRAA